MALHSSLSTADGGVGFARAELVIADAHVPVDPARTHKGDRERRSTARSRTLRAAEALTRTGAVAAHGQPQRRRTSLRGCGLGRLNGRAPSLAASSAVPSSGCTPPRWKCSSQRGGQPVRHREADTHQKEGGDGWASSSRTRTGWVKQRASQTRPHRIAPPHASPATCARTGLLRNVGSQRARCARCTVASALELADEVVE